MITRVCLLALFLLTAVFNLPAADDDDFVILDWDDLEETVIVVRHRAAPPLSPSSRTIKADEFQGKFSDLPAVIETVSGINVRSMGGHGQYAEAAIRGGAAMGLRVYLDGILLNSASAGAVDLSKIPLDKITEIRVTKSTSGLRQIGAGMGGVIELFTDTGAKQDITGVNVEAGSYGYLRGGMIIRKPVNEIFSHQLNINIANSANDYPFIHDNGTTIPTTRDPDPTWNDTLMYKSNNHYRSVDAAYSLSIDIADRHRVTQRVSAGAFEQGLFVYHFKDEQSGSTGGYSLIYNIEYSGEAADRLTIGGEAGGIYRHSKISDPDGRYSLGGTGKELEAAGGSANFLIDARYALTENFYLAGMTGTRFEHHTQRNLALSDRPEMSRYEYRIGAEAGLTAGITESALRAVYKYETDTSSAGFGYGPSDGKRHTLAYPSAEAVFRLNLHPADLRFSAATSKRSPTFFEKFGWSSGFLSNPDLREETRMEIDAGVSIDMGRYSGALSSFAGRVDDKIKSIPQNSFVKVMNFASTNFYGAEFDVNARILRILAIELSASYLKSIISKAADPSWIGKIEPFIPEFSGFLKTELDVGRINIGHGIKYEGECYLNIENREKKSAQWELSAWAGYRVTDFLTLRYRVDNYMNTANFDFLDNPMPKRTHVFTINFNF